MYGLWPPSSLCAGRGEAGPSLHAGRKAAGRAQCSIVRVTGVVRMMVAKLAKKSVGGRPALAPLATEKGPTPGVKGARTR